MPLGHRLFAIICGVNTITANFWLEIFGQTPLHGWRVWILFAAGVIMLLAGIYGDFGYYSQTKEDKVQ